MALTNEQYENIMREYAAIRERNSALQRERREEVCAASPEYRALDRNTGAAFLRALKARLSGGEDDGSDAARIVARKRAILEENGFPPDYLDDILTCPDCRDTGYIGTQKCHCFRRREIAILYDQSHLSQLVRTENFGMLRDDLFTGEDRQRFLNAAGISRKFAEHFGETYENLYFYGSVGTGKSFLSVCAANEILQRGFAVIYFSAADLFDRLAAVSFDYSRKADLAALTDDLCGCDLLVIDDLGTELGGTFVAAKLFSLLNERILRRKPTIISTNLTIEDVRSRYSDRVFSRIVSSFTICKLSGPDLRLVLKRVRRSENAPV